MAGKMSNMPIIEMDAREFLKIHGKSIQAKTRFFESLVRKMGDKIGKTYDLSALDKSYFIYEDKDDNQYYRAEYKYDNGKVSVENVNHIKIVESNDKKAEFSESIENLIEAISEEKFDEADKHFKLIELHRFRPNVIPESGHITTKDGITRKVTINKEIVNENKVSEISETITEALKDNIEISEGKVVRGTFLEDGSNITIPINEYTRRKIVARYMKNIAEEAYKSKSFNRLVKDVAALISGNNIREAVELSAKFFKEEQEFCLLTKDQFQSLVENSLAVNNKFNSLLSEDVSKLMYKTNIKINKESITEAWSRTAKKAGQTALLEDVRSLSDSSDFEGDYNKILESVLVENDDVKSQKAKAYAATLQSLHSVISRIEGKETQAQDMQNMIDALLTNEPDEVTLQQAESLLASISDSVIASNSNLNTYDSVDTIDFDDETDSDQSDMDLPDLEEVPSLDNPESSGPEMPGMEMPGMGAEAGAPQQQQAPAMAGIGMEGKDASTPINEMNVNQLDAELHAWLDDGDNRIKNNYDESFDKINKLIGRCTALSENKLRVKFENIRNNMIIGESIHSDANDIYSYSSNLNIDINDEYTGLNEGSVLSKKVQTTDGTDSAGAKNAGTGSPSGDAKPGKAKGKGVASKSVGKDGTPEQPSKTKSVGKKKPGSVTESKVDAIEKADGSSVMSTSVDHYKSSLGTKSAGTGGPPSGDPKPGKPTGKGLVSKSMVNSDGRDGGSTAGNSGLIGGDSSPSEPTDDIQDKMGGSHSNPGKGLAESFDDIINSIAESMGCPCCDGGECDCPPECDHCDCSVNESQYKHPVDQKSVRNFPGYKRGKYDKKKKSGKSVNEEVEISVSGTSETGRNMSYHLTDSDGDVEDVISAIASRLETDDVSGGEVISPDEAEGDTPLDTDLGDPAMAGDFESEIGDTLDDTLPGDEELDGEGVGEEPPIPDEESELDTELGDEELGDEEDMDLPAAEEPEGEFGELEDTEEDSEEDSEDEDTDEFVDEEEELEDDEEEDIDDDDEDEDEDDEEDIDDDEDEDEEDEDKE